MPLLFDCPYCHAETLVEDAYLGQSGPCATCGRIVTIPDHPPGTRRTVTESVAKAGLSLHSAGLLIAILLGSLLVGALVIGLGVAIIAPAVRVARASSLKAKSAERLEMIAQALQAYHADHGSYPPAYVADASGKPMHSWRVLILPYLGERVLYQQYDMNQPWDSPTNIMLLGRMPQVYISPGDDAAKMSFDTSYVVVVGPNTIFPGAQSRSMNDVTDGLANTILVVESTASGICWMEPRDLDASKMDYSINAGPNNCMRSHHPYGAQAVFADGRTRFLTEDLPAEYVEALTTAASNDQAPLELLGAP
jgi:type II secretory pathway pseudopilin PulG